MPTTTPRYVSVHVRLTPEAVEELRTLARLRERTVSGEIRAALAEHLAAAASRRPRELA